MSPGERTSTVRPGLSQTIPPQDRRFEISLFLILVAAAIAARLVYLRSTEAFYDDAYITFRFARNLATRGSFSFNPGEEVFGASSPLYTLLMALVRWCTSDALLPEISRWIGFASLAGLCALVWFLFPLARPARVLAVGALLAYPRIFYASIGGMEEITIGAVMVLSATAVLRDWKTVFGVSLGVLFLLKIDTLPWIAIILLAAIVKWRAAPLKPLMLSAVIALPWIAWSLATFGSILPHTVMAKRVAFPSTHPFSFDDFISIPAPESIQAQFTPKLLLAAVLFGILIATAVRAIRKRDWIFLVFPVYGVAYTLFLAFSGVELGLWVRWTVPLWIMLLIGGAYLAEGIFSVIGPWSSSRMVSIFLALVGVIALVVPIVYENRKSMDSEAFRQTSDWLCEHSAPGETVMLEPIGLIGFTTDLYVHDMIGLVSPEVTAAREATGRADSWYMAYVRKHRPTYLILRPDELLTNRFFFGGYGGEIFSADDSVWFRESYEAVFTSLAGPRANWLVTHRLRSPDAKEGVQLLK